MAGQPESIGSAGSSPPLSRLHTGSLDTDISADLSPWDLWSDDNLSEMQPPKQILAEAAVQPRLAMKLSGGLWNGVKLAQLSSSSSSESESAPAQARPKGFSVARELRGSVVVLTGVTGYIGGLILELILRTCPEVQKVYCVVRSKKGKTPEDRLQELFKSPIFRLLQPNLPNLRHKVQLVNADLAEPNCGLAPADQELLVRETNYIIHSAASILFDMPIQAILRNNFLPTSALLQLAESMAHLRCFTYVSTAFVNANQPKGTCLQEEIYPLMDVDGSPADAEVIAHRLLALSPKKADEQAEKLMKKNKLQNTYFLAKNMSERKVMKDDLKLRTCIVRPSIVGSVAYAPFPGWIGNTSGFTALILGAAAGILFFGQHDKDSTVPLVPADIVSATILVATAAHGSTKEGEEPPCGRIVHACTSDTQCMQAKRVHDIISQALAEQRPLKGTMIGAKSKIGFTWVESDLSWLIKCAQQSAKVAAASAMLKMQGHGHVAKKLQLGWKTWQQLGSKGFDFNISFDATAARKLSALLPEDEQTTLKLLWLEPDDSWMRYMRTYVAGVRHLYRREVPESHDIQDYRPFTPEE